MTGITVLDLGQAFMGPYCGLLMQRLGADVIKVEPPQGEPYRRPTARKGVEAMQFSLLNAGKRSLCIDLKYDAGRQLFFDLATTADVVIQNFAPAPLTDLSASTLCSRRTPGSSSRPGVDTGVLDRIARCELWISRFRRCRE